ncbi:hypothetical protein BS47DRAFT_1287462, partial [Hydnum rufescens UP504]
NRFGIEAYDRNRIVFADDPDRYINASYVREGAGGRWWVAAEAPSKEAVHAFLSLFLPPEDSLYPSARIHTIVQLSPQGEGSSHPPEPYFPPTLSHAYTIHAERGSTLPPLQVQTIKQKRISKANCTKTTFVISRPTRRSQLRETESFEVVHLLFESWPAKSVPNSDGLRALIHLIHLIYPLNTRPQQRHSHGHDDGHYKPKPKKLPHTDPPILVHCSEGGRTGTFIAINSLLRAQKCIPSPYDDIHTAPRIPPSPLGPPPSEIAADPVLREIDHIRDQRAAMIDNEAQVLSPLILFTTYLTHVHHPWVFSKRVVAHFRSASYTKCSGTVLLNGI